MTAMPGLGADPAVGSADAVADTAGMFRRRADAASDDGERALAALDALAGSVADSIDDVRPDVVSLHSKLADASRAADEIGSILESYASEMAELKRRAMSLLADAEAAWGNLQERRAEALNEASEAVFGWTLPWDQVMPAWLYQSDHAYLRRWQYAIDEFQSACDDYRRLAAERAELDEHTERRLREVRLLAELSADWRLGDAGAVTAAEAWAGQIADIGAEDLAALEDPGLVRTVWDSLPRQRQESLIAAAPAVLGILGGLPPWARVAANRLNAKARLAEVRRLLDLPPDPYNRRTDQEIAKLQAEEVYLRDAVAGRVQLYLYDQPTHSIIEMIGEIGPHTTDINTYVPGTYTSAFSLYRGEVQQVGRWFAANSGGSMATLVWKSGEFPGENEHHGGAGVLGLLEANDEGFALRKGEEIARFQDELRIATREVRVDYNAIGHSWGLAAVTASEMAGAEYDNVGSLAGAGMPSGWEPREGTQYDHFSYTDLLSMGQATGVVWGGRNPGDHPAFESHIYEHESDFTIVVPTQYAVGGALTPPVPAAELPANWNSVDTHNLIASNDPRNERAMRHLLKALD